MKRILFSIFFTIISVVTFAQSIYSDRQLNDSVRFIEGSQIIARSFTDKIVWIFNLSSYSNGDDTVYVLGVKLNAMQNVALKNSGILLIKTFENEIVKLNSFSSVLSSTTLGYSSHKALIGNIGTVTKNELVGNIAYFFIETEDIEKLKNGIQKVRIENNSTTGYLEKTYSKDKAGYNLYTEYELLNKSLTVKHSRIEDDF